MALAAGLLAWLAVYHIGDAAQALCVFVLRCYRVAIAPLVAYCLLLWGVGLAGGYALAYRTWGPGMRRTRPRPSGPAGRSRSRCWALSCQRFCGGRYGAYRG